MSVQRQSIGATGILNAADDSGSAPLANSPRAVIKCLPFLPEAVRVLKSFNGSALQLLQADVTARLQDYGPAQFAPRRTAARIDGREAQLILIKGRSNADVP